METPTVQSHVLRSVKRRTFVVGATSAPFAGCLSSADSPSSESTTDHSTSTVEVRTNNLESNLELEAIVEEQFTVESPSAVSVQLTNTGDTKQTISGGPTLPFEPQRTGGVENSDALYLVPKDGRGVVVTGGDGETLEPDTKFVPTEQENGCWKAKSANMGIVDIGTSVTLGPGESFAQEYVLLAHPNNADCLSHGTYTFTDVVRATEGEFDSKLSVVYG